MPTVIDSLIVELGLDPSKFEKGKKEAAASLLKTKDEFRKQGKEIEGSAGGLEQSFAKLQGRLLGVAAIFLGGMGVKQFAEYMTKLTADTGRLSYQLGISAQELSRWEGAGANVGATAGEIASSIQAMTSAMAAGQLHGVSPLQKFFMAMGIKTSEGGKWRSPTDLYMDMAKWAQGQDPRIATQLFREMGQSQGMINLLLQGPNKLAEYLKKQKEYEPTNADIEKLTKLQTAFNLMIEASQTLGRLMLVSLAPAFTAVIDKVRQLFDLMNIGSKSPEAAAKQGQELHEETRRRFGEPKGFFKGLSDWLTGNDGRTSSAHSPSFRELGVGSSNAGPGPRSQNSWAAPSSGQAQGNKTATAKQAAMEQLRLEGVPENNLDAAASALVGQATAESGLNPNLSHDSGTGYGIYGARLDRRSRMLAWLKKNGFASNSLEGQMKYMAHEAMAGGYPGTRRALMGANRENLGSVNQTLTREFEAPRFNNYGTRFNATLGALRTRVDGKDVWSGGASAIPWLNHPGAIALRNSGGAITNNKSSNEVHIDNVQVNTQATDATGIARDLKPALELNSYIQQGNYGHN